MPRGRPVSAVKSVERKIRVPEKLDAEIQLLLFSEVEMRVPYGEFSNLVTELLGSFLRDFKEAKAAVEAAEATEGRKHGEG